MKILWRAEPIDEVIAKQKLSGENLKKLKLIKEVRRFCFEELGLKKSDNYTEYSQLDENYVSYVVNAAGAYSLDPYLWHYPIVGSLTYKGFPRKDDALEEQDRLIKKGLDTHVRGVSAYSTLGWFDDPVLSSMMNYSEEDIVELIIHESVHEHIYIKSNAEFNEQLANFFAKKATALFYKNRDNDYLERQTKMEHDQKLFASFMEKQKEMLKESYIRWKNLKAIEKEQKKKQAFQTIVDEYKKLIKPKLLVLNYDHIINTNLNNARISLYGTYSDNQDHFENLYNYLNNDPIKFINFFSTWKNEKQPIQRLKNIDYNKLKSN
jgi:predicted aminopeptidase